MYGFCSLCVPGKKASPAAPKGPLSGGGIHCLVGVREEADIIESGRRHVSEDYSYHLMPEMVSKKGACLPPSLR